MVIVDLKTVDFSINGMETAFVILFVVGLLWTYFAPGKRPALALGLVWGGCMWVRPDAFVYIGALGLACLVFPKAVPGLPGRVAILRRFACAGVVAAAVYGPWFIWSWVYYGTFVPHTITAKGLLHTGPSLADIVMYPWRALTSMTTMDLTFLPAYGLSGWSVLGGLSRILSVCLALLWLVPRFSARVRAVSLAFLLLHFYLSVLVPYPYPWYVPGIATVGVTTLVLAIEDVRTRPPKIAIPVGVTRRIAMRSVGVSAGALAICMATVTMAGAYQLRIQQTVIESGNRKQIGLWLRAHAGARDRVMLEPLGYIGFYSNMKPLDVPGLASAEVVAARRRLRTTAFDVLMNDLHPEWVVLRPSEVRDVRTARPQLFDIYRPVKTFDVADRVRSYAWLPGRAYLEHDQTFTVFRLMERSRADGTGDGLSLVGQRGAGASP